MNLLGLLDVSGSALRAQRIRAEVVASNMANAETTRTPDGGPYRRHHVLFSEAGAGSFRDSLLRSGGLGGLSRGEMRSGAATPSGVEVAGVIEDGGPAQMRFDPTHPDARKDGYVAYPDINPTTEMVDLMGASRSYSMNVSAVQAEKGMLLSSLELLK